MGRPIVVIGDLLLDVIATPAAPIRIDGDVPATVRLLPGGQGGNLAVRLARRGRDVRLVAPLADDAGGALLRDACAADGVHLDPLAATRSGSVVILVDADGRRSMLSDRIAGAVPERLDPDAATLCSCYALLDAAGDALALLLGGRASGSFLALAGCAVETPAATAALLARMRTARPELAICNRSEAVALVGSDDADLPTLAARLGAGLGTLALVTDAARGSASSRRDVEMVAPVKADSPSLDTTGVGDAYAAAVVDALVDVDWPPGRRALGAAMRAGAALAAEVAAAPGAQARVPLESRALAAERRE
jgi:sugar/nucleoside kinase (ribokinase family)